MGKVDLYVQMVVFIKVKLLMIYHMVLENFNMLIKINTLGVLIKELDKEKENIIIVKERYSVGHGKMIRRCMVHLHYSMEMYLKEISKII
jgi:hypothetical protein